MPLPKTKAEQALDIFNRLAELDLGDVEEAVRLLFRIRAMDVGYPDATIKICRADAALIAGYRQEAIASLDDAYRLRSDGNLAMLQRLQLVLLLCGQTPRAVEVGRTLLSTPGAASKMININLVITALWAGDLVLLREISEKEEKTGESLAAPTLSLIFKSGIDKLFQEHQRVVRDVLQDYQMGVWSRVNEDDEIDVSVINMYYFDGTQIDRRTLEHQLDEALDALYRQKRMDDAAWRGKIITIITEAPRHLGAGLRAGDSVAA